MSAEEKTVGPETKDQDLLELAKRITEEQSRTETLVSLERRGEWLEDDGAEATVYYRDIKTLFLGTDKPIVLIDDVFSHPLSQVSEQISPAWYARFGSKQWQRVIGATVEALKLRELKEPVYNVYFGTFQDHGSFGVFESHSINELTNDILVQYHNPKMRATLEDHEQEYTILRAEQKDSILKVYEEIQNEENYEFLLSERERKEREEKERKLYLGAKQNRDKYIRMVKELFPGHFDLFSFDEATFTLNVGNDFVSPITSPYASDEGYVSRIFDTIKRSLDIYDEAQKREQIRKEANKWIVIWLSDPTNEDIVKELLSEPGFVRFEVEYYSIYKITLVGVEGDNGLDETIIIHSEYQPKFLQEFEYKLKKLLAVRRGKRDAMKYVKDYYDSHKRTVC